MTHKSKNRPISEVFLSCSNNNERQWILWCHYSQCGRSEVQSPQCCLFSIKYLLKETISEKLISSFINIHDKDRQRLTRTNRVKHGQTGTSRDKRECPCFSLLVPVCPCIFNACPWLVPDLSLLVPELSLALPVLIGK